MAALSLASLPLPEALTPSPPPEPPVPPDAGPVVSQPAQAEADRPNDGQTHFTTSRRSSTLRFWVLLTGWILSSVVGLAVGYLLVLWLFPEIDLPRPW
jgi:hypothetical protein